MKRWLTMMTVMVSVGWLTACGHPAQQPSAKGQTGTGQSSPKVVSLGKDVPLPSKVAQKPAPIKVPEGIQANAATGVRHGKTVRFSAKSVWIGKQVKIYFIPAQDLMKVKGQLSFQRVRDAQLVAHTAISKNKWDVDWSYADATFPAHGWYFLIRSDMDQNALVHVP